MPFGKGTARTSDSAHSLHLSCYVPVYTITVLSSKKGRGGRGRVTENKYKLQSYYRRRFDLPFSACSSFMLGSYRISSGEGTHMPLKLPQKPLVTTAKLHGL